MPETFLNSRHVLTRYGWSRTTLWRKDNDPESTFPKPIVDGNKKLYPFSGMLAWEKTRAGVKPVAPQIGARTPPPRRTRRTPNPSSEQTAQIVQ